MSSGEMVLGMCTGLEIAGPTLCPIARGYGAHNEGTHGNSDPDRGPGECDRFDMCMDMCTIIVTVCASGGGSHAHTQGGRHWREWRRYSVWVAEALFCGGDYPGIRPRAG